MAQGVQDPLDALIAEALGGPDDYDALIQEALGPTGDPPSMLELQPTGDAPYQPATLLQGAQQVGSSLARGVAGLIDIPGRAGAALGDALDYKHNVLRALGASPEDESRLESIPFGGAPGTVSEGVARDLPGVPGLEDSMMLSRLPEALGFMGAFGPVVGATGLAGGAALGALGGASDQYDAARRAGAGRGTAALAGAGGALVGGLGMLGPAGAAGREAGDIGQAVAREAVGGAVVGGASSLANQGVAKLYSDKPIDYGQALDESALQFLAGGILGGVHHAGKGKAKAEKPDLDTLIDEAISEPAPTTLEAIDQDLAAVAEAVPDGSNRTTEGPQKDHSGTTPDSGPPPGYPGTEAPAPVEMDLTGRVPPEQQAPGAVTAPPVPPEAVPTHTSSPEEALGEQVAAPGSPRLFHGTTAPQGAEFSGDVAYLTSDNGEAGVFASNPILSMRPGSGKGPARVVEVSGKGIESAVDVTAEVEDAIAEDGDVDQVITNLAAKHRASGARFLKFQHPSGLGDGEFTAYVALHPSELGSAPSDPQETFPEPPAGKGSGESLGQAPEPEPTSIKNATVDRELAEMGLPPATHGERHAWEQANEEAAARFEKDPQAGANLVRELQANERPITDTENAVLLREQVRLRNERDAASTAYIEAQRTGDTDTAATAKARLEQARADLVALYEVDTKVGTKNAQALAARKMAMAADYSLATLEREWSVAQEGAPLSEKQAAEIKDLHDRLVAAEKAHAEYQVAAEKKAADLAAENEVLRLKKEIRQRAPTGTKRERAIQKTKQDIEAIFQEIVTLSKRARGGTGLDVDLLGAVTRLAIKHIELGIHEVAKFAESVKARLGDGLEPYIEHAWKAAQDARRNELAAPLKARLGQGEPLSDLRGYVTEIAESFVRAGVTEREPLIDAVHGILKEIDPKITREEARDAISGYGDFRPLSKDEVKVKLRDLRGQMQQVAKLEDMLQRKQAPKKTGPERRTPSDTERRLIQEVNEAKKKLGIKTTDPETQLKSALDSLKTRLKNQIADLQTQIDTGQKKSRERTPGPSDPEAEALKAQRDALKAQYDEVFAEPKKGKTEEEVNAARVAAAIKAVERSIADYEQRIASGEIAAKKGQPGPSSPELVAAQKRRDALREELMLLREAAKPSAKPASEAQEKALRKQIASLAEQIEKGERTQKGPRQGPDTEGVAKLKAERAQLARELRELLRKPRKSPEEIALQSYKTRKAHELARMYERLTYEDFAPREKKPPLALDDEAIRLKAEAEKVKGEIRAGEERVRRANRTRAQKALDTALDTANISRSIWSSFDFSAVFRQGAPFTLSSPIKAGAAVAKMLRAAANKDYARRVNVALANRPLADFAQRSKLFMSDAEGGLNAHEEQYRSTWAQKIPGVAASERAFSTYLNIARAELFDRQIRSLPVTPTVEQGRQIASYVNTGTGRGPVGKFAAEVNAASYALWAPRLLISRFQYALGVPLWKGDRHTRKVIAKEYARTLAGLGAIYVLGSMLGGDTEDDPRSSDFGKIKFGKSRVDPLAGLSQITRLVSQVATGERVNSKGQVIPVRGDVPYGQPDAADLTLSFLRTKFTPALGLAFNLASGSNIVGEKVTPESAALDAITPLSLKDVHAAMREQGLPEAFILSMLGLFGMSLQTYEPKAKK